MPLDKTKTYLVFFLEQEDSLPVHRRLTEEECWELAKRGWEFAVVDGELLKDFDSRQLLGKTLPRGY
jgi:hypothetical protein